MSEQFNIDDYLRHTIDDFEVQPRITSFDAVQKKMEQKKKRRALLFLFSGLGIALVFTFTGLFLYQSKTATVKPLTSAITDMPQTAIIRLHTDKSSAQQHQKTKLHAKSKSRSAKKTYLENLQRNKLRPTTSKSTLTGKSNFSENTATALNTQKYTGLINSELPLNPSDSTEPTLIRTEEHKQYLDSTLLAKQDSIIGTTKNDSVLIEESWVQTPLVSEIKSIKRDTLLTDKNTRGFLLGVFLQPQYSSLLVSGDKTAPTGSFEQMYLANRKDHLAVNLNYAFGLTAGYKINSKWELWLKAGYHYLHYYEQANVVSPLTNTGISPIGSLPQYSGKENELGFKNEFSYARLSLKVSRLIMPNPFVKLVVDAGITTNYLMAVKSIYISNISTYDYSKSVSGTVFSRFTGSGYLNFGAIKDINSNLQVRVAPGIFASPTSMFKKDYIIKQRPYGLALECTLVYRLPNK